MASLRAAALASVAASQAGTRLAVGDRFLRRLRVVEVLAVDRSGLTWRDVASRVEETGTRGDFLAFAVERVTAPRSQAATDAAPSLADEAWSIASASSLPAADRARLLLPFAQRTTGAERDEIRSWIADLQRGQQPARREEP